MKQKKKNFTVQPTALLVVVPLLLVSSFLLLLSSPTPKEQIRPLAMIAIPLEPVVYLPEPRIAPTVETSVLGAETINPRDIITYVNEERMKRGVRPLRVNETLMKASQMRAEVIVKHQNFSHQDPYEGIQLDTVLPILKYPYKYASENIGMGDQTGRQFVNGFMNSPPHRANLLNPELVETGVAIVSGPYKQYYVNIAVQLFSQPWDSSFDTYTTVDEREYTKLLSDIGKQLNETKIFKEKDPNNFDYYDRWERLLIRQQEIIAQLSHAVSSEQPYGREMIALMKEYNKNWASVPLN